jgi:acetylornithine deacetylase/succinyl-diaminopimelate desuccinylase-like protein
MDELYAYFEEVDQNIPRMNEFLGRLIKTPSLSGEEEEIAGIVTDEMRDLGYGVDVDEMGNVIARRGGKNGRTILFDGHLDHIQPGALDGWSHPPMQPRSWTESYTAGQPST